MIEEVSWNINKTWNNVNGSTIEEVVASVLDNHIITPNSWYPYDDNWDSDWIGHKTECNLPHHVILATHANVMRPYILISDTFKLYNDFSIIDIVSMEVVNSCHPPQDINIIIDWIIRNKHELLRCWLEQNTIIYPYNRTYILK